VRTFILVVQIDDTDLADAYGPIDDVDAWVEENVAGGLMYTDGIKNVDVYK
jgi:hypothetical protein